MPKNKPYNPFPCLDNTSDHIIQLDRSAYLAVYKDHHGSLHVYRQSLQKGQFVNYSTLVCADVNISANKLSYPNRRKVRSAGFEPAIPSLGSSYLNQAGLTSHN